MTAGGVPLRELDLQTMESRACPGLFVCGEICDVDGRIGGFNFQWAWASGYVAGTGVVGDGHRSELPLNGRIARSLLVRVVQMLTRLGASMRARSRVTASWRNFQTCSGTGMNLHSSDRRPLRVTLIASVGQIRLDYPKTRTGSSGYPNCCERGISVGGIRCVSDKWPAATREGLAPAW